MMFVPLDFREFSRGRWSEERPSRLCSLSEEAVEEGVESGFGSSDDLVWVGSAMEGMGKVSLDINAASETMIKR